MSQWPNSTGAYRISEATRFSISPASAGTSEASKKAERASMQLAHFSQPKTEAPSSTGAPLRIETTEEIGNRSGVFEEGDKEGDEFKPTGGNETLKETLVVALSKRSQVAPSSRSVSGGPGNVGSLREYPLPLCRKLCMSGSYRPSLAFGMRSKPACRPRRTAVRGCMIIDTRKPVRPTCGLRTTCRLAG